MVIGNGLLAKSFSNFLDDDSILIFASGVSNSSETRISEFEREYDLLNEKLSKFNSARLIYFSTLSIFDNVYL